MRLKRQATQLTLQTFLRPRDTRVVKAATTPTVTPPKANKKVKKSVSPVKKSICKRGFKLCKSPSCGQQ